MKKHIALLLIFTLLFMFLGCSKEENKAQVKIVKNSLPATIASMELIRDGEAKTYVGHDLFEYINGGAEVYHLYKFDDVTMAYYKKDSIEIVIDIYKFEDAVNAYGLYASLRPDDPQLVNLGVEGLRSTNRLEFVKGRCMIRLTAYDSSGDKLLDQAALEMSKLIEGAEVMPEQFGLFPVEGMLVSAKFYPESYLGHQFLTEVFTVDYYDAMEPLTFFVTEDGGGEKYLAFSQAAAQQSVRLPLGFGFDGQLGMAIENSYYGTIIFGLKNGMLAGCVNYSDTYRQKMADWINSLP